MTTVTFLAALAALLCAGCAAGTASGNSSSPISPSRDPSTPTSSGPASREARAKGRLAAGDESTQRTWKGYPSHSLLLPLFDAENWHLVATEPWLHLVHPKSSSSFEFRRWRSLRLARLDQCYKQLLLWRPGWSQSEGSPLKTYVDRRKLVQFPGYQVELSVWLERDTNHAQLVGTALAVGVSVGRCFAAAFSTRGSGPGSAERVADKLGVGASFVLERMRFSNIDARGAPAQR